MKAPYLEDRNGQKVLIVDEAPFIMIAGSNINPYPDSEVSILPSEKHTSP